MLEELLEGAFVLQQRHAQVAGGEQQVGAAGGKNRRGAGKQQVVLGLVVRRRVAEGGFLQADALADQPTGEAVPDHQQAFGEKVIRVRQVAFLEAQAHQVAFAPQVDQRRPGEQAVDKQFAALQGLSRVRQ